MPRILFVFLFAVTLAATTLSQTPNQPETVPTCNLSLSQAPAIRGIRLGMKPGEWLKLFPGSEQDERIKAILDQFPQYPEYGVQRIVFESLTSRDRWGGAFKLLFKEEFSGIERVSLTLFDNQITGFQIDYSPNSINSTQVPVWDDVSQLMPIFIAAFNLPNIAAWEKRGSGVATLRCPGFDMELSTLNSSAKATLRSKYNFESIIRQRLEAEKQKHRASFKP